MNDFGASSNCGRAHAIPIAADEPSASGASGESEAGFVSRSRRQLYPAVAVVIPCFNEERTVARVVKSFRSAMPFASIYVCDNNSSDRTIEVALAAGAKVWTEQRQGKGHVVRRMLAGVDADVYVLVDGDDTYQAEAAPRLVKKLIDERLDFLNAARVPKTAGAYRAGHQWGNDALTALVNYMFDWQFKDMLSGYKILSRRFAKSFPASSRGFEIEAELTVHALELRMACAEESTIYGVRPAGSTSKLRTFRDGFRILGSIAQLVRNERPFQFFTFIAVSLVAGMIVIDLPIVQNYWRTGLVPRLPTVVLSLALMIVGVLSFFAGLILDMVATTRRELKRLIYLSVQPYAPSDS